MNQSGLILTWCARCETNKTADEGTFIGLQFVCNDCNQADEDDKEKQAARRE